MITHTLFLTHKTALNFISYLYLRPVWFAADDVTYWDEQRAGINCAAPTFASVDA